MFTSLVRGAVVYNGSTRLVSDVVVYVDLRASLSCDVIRAEVNPIRLARQIDILRLSVENMSTPFAAVPRIEVKQTNGLEQISSMRV